MNQSYDAHERKKPEDGLGDGQAAWATIEEKCDAVSNATRQQLHDEVAKSKLRQGQDPGGFLYIMARQREDVFAIWARAFLLTVRRP